MPVRFKHLFVTTDFTEGGDRALPWAFELARQNGAKLTLCHVLDAVRPPNPIYAQLYPKSLFRGDALDAAKTRAREALQERAVAASREASYELAVSQGDPADEIVRHAEEQECDLIVLAPGRRRHLLGSVAEKVVRRSRCAVLVVR